MPVNFALKSEIQIEGLLGSTFQFISVLNAYIYPHNKLETISKYFGWFFSTSFYFCKNTQFGG